MARPAQPVPHQSWQRRAGQCRAILPARDVADLDSLHRPRRLAGRTAGPDRRQRCQRVDQGGGERARGPVVAAPGVGDQIEPLVTDLQLNQAGRRISINGKPGAEIASDPPPLNSDPGHPGPARRTACCAGPSPARLAASPAPGAAARVSRQRRRDRPDRAIPDQAAHRQLDADRPRLADRLHSQDGVAAKLKEIVSHRDGVPAQHAAPDLGEPQFRRRHRLSVRRGILTPASRPLLVRRIRQRADIELARRCQRQVIDSDQHAGQRVLGQPRGQGRHQSRLVSVAALAIGRDDIAHEPLPALLAPDGHDRPGDARLREQHGLDRRRARCGTPGS